MGLDHELMPNFGLSASYTWRRYNNVIWPLTQLPVVGVTSADYLLDGRSTRRFRTARTSALRTMR